MGKSGRKENQEGYERKSVWHRSERHRSYANGAELADARDDPKADAADADAAYA